MKQLDRLLIKTFIPPFIVTFGIAMFVLLMQILWLYIDDIAGKDLGAFVIIELLAYKCVGLVPMALPLATLISSVMVLGGLAEHYELSSFKSAGVRLLRVMRPIIVFGIGTMVLSYICSDYLIPVANLKFGSRMYDIQQKKATLSIDAGVFNDDFTNYAIRVGGKERDGRTINDVLIYDHSQRGSGRLNGITARNGEMFTTPDNHYFVIELKDGHQYMETASSGPGGGGDYRFVRVSFDSWTKLFDLSEFQLSRTNEELFQQNRSMLSSRQLRVAIDSMQIDIRRQEIGMGNHLSNYLTVLALDTTLMERTGPNRELTAADSARFGMQRVVDTTTATLVISQDSIQDPRRRLDSAAADRPTANTPPQVPLRPTTNALPSLQASLSPLLDTARSTPVVALAPARKDSALLIRAGQLVSMGRLLDSLDYPQAERILNRARSAARSVNSQAEATYSMLDRQRENRVKFIYELHMKYSMAVVCIIFVFIGAPMGAIVRKGGFGYPILVSIIFFVIFVTLTIFCRKIAETFVLPAALAGWIPCLVLFPIGLFLTSKAMNDSRLSVNLDGIRHRLRRLMDQKRDAANAQPE